MRIATGCIGHETNTFSPVVTTLASFVDRTYYRGAEVIEAFAGTQTITGGFIAGAKEVGVELVPLLWTFATPSGLVAKAAYEQLKKDFLTALSQAGRLDGVLLDLHGAMATEDIEDAEGDLIAAVRQVVGAVPIVTTLDLHANITALMAEQADCLIGFDTYPHVDCYERGLEAVGLIAAAVEAKVRPTMAYRQLPFLSAPPAQCTLRAPMTLVLERLHGLEAREGVLTATVSMGFPFADIRDAGGSVLVTTDGDAALAEVCADELAAYIWSIRQQFQLELLPVDAAVERAKNTAGPVVLADGADNPGGGGPCDGTAILAALLAADAQDAVVAVIADAQSVAAAIGAGVGNEVQLEIGGKTDRKHGEPVKVKVRVQGITDGNFVLRGPMGRGQRAQLGRTAVVVAGGVEIVLTEHRFQPFDAEVLRSVGITPETRQIIALKSAVHFRADYGPIAAEILEVDAPGVHSPNLFGYDYQKLRRPIFPLDKEVEF